MSAEACVTPVDTFPPVPPSDLRLFWRNEQTDLSWSESTSLDVLGYHVYRTGPGGEGFQRLTLSIIGRTSYTDSERDPQGRYRYAVTAVDGADPPNESLPSDSRQVNPR
jgi:fibronectin type 3 domain-containing protein